jgi:hypothetical protein
VFYPVVPEPIFGVRVKLIFGLGCHSLFDI